MGLALGVPLGFANGYALAASAEVARKHGLKTLGDLRNAPDLRIAISQEFLGREDGWPGLARRYQLPQRPTSIDHGLSYQALASQRIDLTDIYTTDARIADLGLVTLQDNANYFPATTRCCSTAPICPRARRRPGARSPRSKAASTSRA